MQSIYLWTTDKGKSKIVTVLN